jgi:2-polyprenyl-3-methyl-5-hydroxy-6-metoxy-1,4-benzoquinol methylase
VGQKQATKYFEQNLGVFGPSLKAIGYDRHDAYRQYQVLRDQMGIRPGETVLDVGCALGLGSTLFTDCAYIGLDASRQMVDHSAALHADVDEPRSTKFRLGTPKDLSGQVFDWVLAACIFSVGYAADEAEAVLRDCWNLTTKGLGVTFLTHAPPGKLKAFPQFRWLAMAERLSPRYVYRKDFADHIGALCIYRR